MTTSLSLDSCKSLVDDATDDHIGHCIGDYIGDVCDVHERAHFNLCSYLSLRLHSHWTVGTPWDQKELTPLLPESYLTQFR